MKLDLITRASMAHDIAVLGRMLPGPTTPARSALAELVVHLGASPPRCANALEVLATLNHGLPEPVVPAVDAEARILTACAALLAEPAAPSVVDVPPALELDTWMESLDDVTGLLDAIAKARSMASRDATGDRAELTLDLDAEALNVPIQMLRVWLISMYVVRLRVDADAASTAVVPLPEFMTAPGG